MPSSRESRSAVGSAVLFVVIALTGTALGCSDASVAGDDTGIAPLVGNWRGVLLSAGGELPFRIRVDAEGAVPPGSVFNGAAAEPFTRIARQGAASYTLSFYPAEAAIDSELVARMAPDADTLHGYWRLTFTGVTEGSPDEAVTQLPFTATRDDARRFQRNDPTLEVAPPEAAAMLPDISGAWQVVVGGEPGPTTSVASFRQSEEQVVMELVSGSAPGQLEGIYRNGLLRMSRFDGLQAVMVHARATTDGGLEGTLWRQQEPGVSWSARRR